jgi:hypothetical protein
MRPDWSRGAVAATDGEFRNMLENMEEDWVEAADAILGGGRGDAGDVGDVGGSCLIIEGG